MFNFCLVVVSILEMISVSMEIANKHQQETTKTPIPMRKFPMWLFRNLILPFFLVSFPAHFASRITKESCKESGIIFFRSSVWEEIIKKHENVIVCKFYTRQNKQETRNEEMPKWKHF